MKKCVFAGTFDPFTVGHEDTVKKALTLFDEVVVAVAENREKRCLFSAEEREEMIALLYRGEERVRVVRWGGAIVDLLERENTPFYVRGLRNAADYAYENEDFFASRDLLPSLVTLYFPAEREHLHISSTLVKNCLHFGKPYEPYVPAVIGRFLAERRPHV